MNIDKDQILQLLKGNGEHEKAKQAHNELPDQIDPENPEHKGLLSKFGIDPSVITDKLGGLGGSLGSVL